MSTIVHRAIICPAVALAAVFALNAQSRPERISPENVGRLAVAWTYDTRDPTQPVQPGRKPPAFEATPVHVDGRLYRLDPVRDSRRPRRRHRRRSVENGPEDPEGRQLQRVHRPRARRERRPSLCGNGRRAARVPRPSERGTVPGIREGRTGRSHARSAACAAILRRVRRQLAAGDLPRPRDRGFVRRRQQPRAHGVRRSARVRRAIGRTAMDVPPAPCRCARRRRQHLVTDRRRRAERAGVPADGKPEPGLLRRAAHGHRRLRQLDRRAPSRDRRGRLELPDRPPRSLGLRRRVAGAALRGEVRAGGRRRLEDGTSLPFRSDLGKADLRHQRAAGAGKRRRRREGGADAALSRAAAEPRATGGP